MAFLALRAHSALVDRQVLVVDTHAERLIMSSYAAFAPHSVVFPQRMHHWGLVVGMASIARAQTATRMSAAQLRQNDRLDSDSIPEMETVFSSYCAQRSLPPALAGPPQYFLGAQTDSRRR
jgi:hypothetical protein